MQRNWAMFDGWSASSGFDPMDLPYDRFLSAAYYFLVKDADPDSKTKFDTRLWIPPKGVEPEKGSVWSPEGETEAFAAFTKQFTQGDPIAAKNVAAPDQKARKPAGSV